MYNYMYLKKITLKVFVMMEDGSSTVSKSRHFYNEKH